MLNGRTAVQKVCLVPQAAGPKVCSEPLSHPHLAPEPASCLSLCYRPLFPPPCPPHTHTHTTHYTGPSLPSHRKPGTSLYLRSGPTRLILLSREPPDQDQDHPKTADPMQVSLSLGSHPNAGPSTNVVSSSFQDCLVALRPLGAGVHGSTPR